MTKETETAIEKPNYLEMSKRVVTLDEVCPVHNVHYLQLNKAVLIAGENKPRHPKPYCPVCVKEGISQKELSEIEKSQNQGLYLKTYNILESKSTVPKELKSATFDNFIAETPEEKQLLAFAKGQVQKYLDGMAGNTLITGSTGVGKSHLSYALWPKQLTRAIGLRMSLRVSCLSALPKSSRKSKTVGIMAAMLA